MQLDGNTFLITGAASGLGAACARRFVKQGAAVILADIDEPLGASLAAELGDRAHFQKADVRSVDDVQQALAVAQKWEGPLRGAVNCAGILDAARIVGRDGPHPLEMFSRVIEVNLIGTFNVMRLAAAAMSREAADADGARGVVVNTASVSAFEGQIGQAAYSASKGGVASMTLPAARELARFGIRVVAIAPGVFRTAMMEAAPEKVLQSLTGQTVFPKHLGDPVDFARLAEHIVENPMLNGSVLRLDGAMRMREK